MRGILGYLVTLFVVGGVLVMGGNKMARGIRNNNPLNIEHNKNNNWDGASAVQTDSRFVQFVSPVWGIRAAAKTFKTYSKRGVNTLAGIISTWAPPEKNGVFENDTEAYIASIEKQTGFSRHDYVGVERYPALIAAMIKHENGSQPYAMELIHEGVSRA